MFRGAPGPLGFVVAELEQAIVRSIDNAAAPAASTEPPCTSGGLRSAYGCQPPCSISFRIVNISGTLPSGLKSVLASQRSLA